mmetsp:Transcript_16668/g.21274  ORF Transcript_16668/g.21274 Transcript_16668/m.21274 type:complete len:104 (-) Transcript_16668:407-718(-)
MAIGQGVSDIISVLKQTNTKYQLSPSPLPNKLQLLFVQLSFDWLNKVCKRPKLQVDTYCDIGRDICVSSETVVSTNNCNHSQTGQINRELSFLFILRCGCYFA